MEFTNILPNNLSYKMEKRPNINVPSHTFHHLILEHHFDEDKSTQGSLADCGSLGSMMQLTNLSFDSEDDLEENTGATLMTK